MEFEHRNAFKAIIKHQAKWQEVPSQKAFGANYPKKAYRLSDAPDSIDFYIDTIRTSYENYLLEVGLSEALDAYEEGDTEGTRNRLGVLLGEINTEVTRAKVTDLTKTRKARLERYQAYRNGSNDSLRGISSGFWSIDQYTQGFQPQQLVTFVGPPAAGKSTLMLLADIAAHKAAYSPLFIGFEMSNVEQEERHDAIRANVSHESLRKGTLAREEMGALKKMMFRTKDLPPLIFSEDTSSSLTVSGISAQIDRYKPDIAFIDGVYMMEDEEGERRGSPQALTNITRMLKQMARAKKMPIVISTQVLLWKMDRKKGVTAGSIGYASSFMQDSDEVIAVERTDDPQINKVKSLKSRNSAGAEIYVMWDWNTGRFEELENVEVRVDDDPATF